MADMVAELEGRDRLATQIHFEARKPSQLIRSGQPESNLGLIGLVRFGYGLENDSSADLVAKTKKIFGGEDHRRQTYLAFEDKTLVGSVTFGLWTPDEAKRGVAFWSSLPQVLRERAQAVSALAVDMVGIVTLPQVRGRGIGGQLLEQGVLELNPSIIVGETKSPQQVVSRARTLASLGYRTFFGHSEITPGHEVDITLEHKVFVMAYLAAKREQTMPGGVIYALTEILRPTVPEASSFDPIIQESFRAIVDAQRKIGREHTVVRPLISVRAEVLAAG